MGEFAAKSGRDCGITVYPDQYHFFYLGQSQRL